VIQGRPSCASPCAVNDDPRQRCPQPNQSGNPCSRAVPDLQRRGPLVTDENGAPVRRRYYWDLYRDGADAAGVPRAVWNMHARHGGATEAQQAGVALADIAEHAQHSDINTTRKDYIVPSVETSRRVAKQRVAHRQAKKNTP
jgi:site-specific recombinase XerD